MPKKFFYFVILTEIIIDLNRQFHIYVYVCFCNWLHPAGSIGLMRHNILSRHALPNRDHIYSISEVIIKSLNTDQHQHQKAICTNSRINSEIKQHLWKKGLVWESVFVVVYKSCMENNFLPNR